MAKQPRQLTRALVQDYLKKDQPGAAAPEPPKKKKKRGAGFVGTRVTMVTRAMGNTLVEGMRAELTSSDLKTRVKGFVLGCAVAAGVLILLSVFPSMRPLKNKVYDIKMQLRGDTIPSTGHLVHLDIDSKSLGAIGRWPWERRLWSGFVLAAKDAGVSRLAFDIEFDRPQAAEPDQRAFEDFRQWKDEELVARLGQGNERLVAQVDALGGALREAFDKIVAISTQLATATTPEDRERLSAALDTAKQEAMRASFLGAQELSGSIREQDPTGELSRQFDRRIGAMVIDHDEAFAAALREAGNVSLPISFASGSNDLVLRERRVEWTRELAEHVFNTFDKIEDPDSIRPDDVVGALLSGPYSNEKPITEDTARTVADNSMDVLKRLYLYRMVFGWYADKGDELVRAHMKEYLDDWQHASAELRTRPGEVFERLRGRIGNPKSRWGKQAETELQKFYSWYLLRHGKPGEQPWTFDISHIEDYDPKAYDPWAKRSKESGMLAGSLAHYRDIELSAPIFRLLDPCVGAGFVVIEPDEDGTLRRMPLFVVYEETRTGDRCLIPHIGFAALLSDVRARRESVRIRPGNYVEFAADSRLIDAQTGDEATRRARIGEVEAAGGTPDEAWKTYRITIDESCSMLINWYGSSTTPYPEVFEHLPAAYLMNAASLKEEARRNRERWETALAEYRLQLRELAYTPPAPDGRTDALERYFSLPLSQTTAAMRDLKLLSGDNTSLLLRRLEKALLNYGASSYDPAKELDAFKAAFRGVLDLPPDAPDSLVAARIPGEKASATEALARLFDVAAKDLQAPLGKLTHRKIEGKLEKLGDKRVEFVRTVLEAMAGLLDPAYDFDGAKRQLYAMFEAAYGAPPEGAAETDAGARDALTGGIVGRLFKDGAALRTLLFTRRQALDAEELERAKGTGAALPGAAHALSVLRWEIPLLVEAGMLAPGTGDAIADDPALLSRDIGLAAGKVRAFRAAYSKFSEIVERFDGKYDEELERVRGMLGGSFALVGAAATALGDLVSTPIHDATPGPSSHMNTYNTALYEMEPVEAPWASKVLGAIMAVIISFFAVRLSIKWGIIAIVGAFAAYLAIDTFAYFAAKEAILETDMNLLAMFAPFIAIQAYRYGVEYRAKMAIKGQFGKYLAPEVVEQLQKDPKSLKLGGDEVELAVYFSDIAGFTPISESMSPQRLIFFLNDYMTRMTEYIRESNGTVDKFIGDAVMAFWGAPSPLPDASMRACKAAVRNAQKLTEWNRERATRGELEVGTRIGIATGPMVVGNMGTEWRMNYTCIGDTVNLAARLEAANKQYGTQIMTNDRCYNLAKDIAVAHIMDNIAVKGKKKGVPVYHLIGLQGEVDMDIVEGCQIYTEAFALYQKEKWAEALPKFKQAKVLLPPAYNVKLAPSDHMIERCEQLSGASLEARMELLGLPSQDAEWDGVWHLHSK